MSGSSSAGTSWAAYQDEVADFFRQLGVSATVGDTLHGVRTDHDVDVAVRFRQFGSTILWIIECKLWQTRITKLHVLALRTIVSDVGADRGIILAERGFQRGAIEAAKATNVGLVSLSELRVLAENEVVASGLHDLADRVDECATRYWSMPKEHRIAHGLRPEVGTVGSYSAPIVLQNCRDAIALGLRGRYPIASDPVAASAYPELAISATAARDLLNQLKPLVDDLEARLRAAEAPGELRPARPDGESAR